MKSFAKTATRAAGKTMYLDTAGIVKLLVPEPDSELFNERVTGEALSTSELAWTEVFSALLSKERDGKIDARERMRAWRTFREWVETEQILLHPLNRIASSKATQVMEQCHPEVPLRSLDAIHTGTCDRAQDFPLGTTDRRMRAAASMLNIPVFPEAMPARR